ncbi:diguanylate cyclase (GGDEF)-like protein [Sphaerotilus hippei]|uniref:Diguanylate cyclase (GGDEF)-like protein n=1 Tax=Sphaerotilus hippei TaxID=744406 RepID=A0A318H048_9BURK|nr:EAL domain-containing protein [Sphaerotilus hippei]PXW94523.1 diguanylate cyclase (GGDEF)-like protein [Sphaerotilus hippei]
MSAQPPTLDLPPALRDPAALRRIERLVLLGFVLLWALIVVVSVLDMRADVRLRTADLIHEAELGTRTKAQELQAMFRELHVSIRTMSLLPPLREAEARNRASPDDDVVDGRRFRSSDAQTLQQLYNHQAALLSVSEVYVVYDGFQPDRGEVPFLMFDQVIVDRFRSRIGRHLAVLGLPDFSAMEATAAGVLARPGRDEAAARDRWHGALSGPARDDADIPLEDEHEEYAYLERLLARERQAHAQLPATGPEGIPMTVSPLLRTCDNSQFLSMRHGDERDRTGLIFSSPIYDARSGRFKGVVATTVRTNMIEARLIGWPFLPVSEADRGEAVQAGMNLQAPPAEWVLEHAGLGVRVMDRRHPQLASWLEAPGGSAQGSIVRVSAEVPVAGEAGWMLHRYLAPAQIEQIERQAGLSLLWRAGAATVLLLLLGGTVLHSLRSQRRGHVQLHALANFDPLTGLPNRRQLQSRIEAALLGARRRHARMALVMIDLDDFKQVNDTLGHGAGDRLLVELSRRFGERLAADDRARHVPGWGETPLRLMADASSEGALLGRLGGDEFLVLLPEVSDDREALAVVDSLLAALIEPVHIDGQPTYCRASIGVALYPQHGHDADTLLRSADQAMYAAKRVNGSSVALFEQELDQDSVRRLKLLTELHGALERGEFLLHYQPVLDVASGSFRSAEALLRWRHPQFGLVSPGEFVPLLERSGLIVPVGRWVLGEAARQVQRWRLAGSPLRGVSVNLSAVQIAQTDYSAEAVHIVETIGVEPEALTVEITESVLMDNSERNIAQLEVLRAAGMRLAIDDFGKGYSSLGYLRQFPVNVLKIDRALLTDANNATGRAILYTVADLAQRMGIDSVGEGAEDREQFDSLIDAGCTAVQGYFLARPMRADLADDLARHFDLDDHLIEHPALPPLPTPRRPLPGPGAMFMPGTA